jgi:OmpA-OmpF porin, OOP family
MRPVKSLILGAALVAATASASFAQQMFGPFPSGLYFRGDVGGALGVSTTGKDTNPKAATCLLCTTTQPTSLDTSFIFGAGIGYRFTPAYRADITLDDIPDLTGNGHNSGVPGVRSHSRISSLVALANGYVDFNGIWNVFGPFQPYIGAGIGLAHTDLGTTSLTGTALNGINISGASLSGNTTTHFAWGIGAGVGYPINQNWTLDLGYKYLDLGEMRSGATLNRPIGALTVTPIKADLQVHTIMLGIRYTFSAPAAPPPTPAAAPAPPPAPPPAAARQEFIVFFEFDKSTLTPDGQKVVDAAAAAYKRGGNANISVAGYTDAAGTQKYNLALSQRRAQTVSAALVKDGVPQSQIAMSYFGKEHQRVPTPDGVREPQNRRVEIDF